jgi:hypothetical protein
MEVAADAADRRDLQIGHCAIIAGISGIGRHARRIFQLVMDCPTMLDRAIVTHGTSGQITVKSACQATPSARARQSRIGGTAAAPVTSMRTYCNRGTDRR